MASRRTWRTQRSVRIAVILAGLNVGPALAVPPAQPEAKSGTLVSTADPYGSCPHRFGEGSDFEFEAGFEAEPHVAINPANPDNQIAVWIQDRGRAGGKANAAGYTFDGGRTWTPVRLPGLSRCQRSSFDADGQSDPWVAFSSDGSVAYVSSTNGFRVDSVPTGAITVVTSRDGGRTWSDPTIVSGPAAPVIGPPDFNDRHAIVVNPLPGRAKTAYITWFRLTYTGLFFELMFSKTTDGGQSWSPPSRIGTPTQFPHAIPTAELAVLPNGHLVVVYSVVRVDANTQPHEGKFFSRVSTDDGATWSDAQPLTGSATDFEETFPADPEVDGRTVRAPAAIQEQAVDADGVLHVAWVPLTARSTNQTSIVMTRSTDGRSWSPPDTIVPARPGTLTFTPTLAANPQDGSVGLTFYDTRNDQPGDAALTTEFWFTRSRDGGRTWTDEKRLAGPFDTRQALVKNASFYFLGDYLGLVPDGRRYGAIYTLTTPLAVRGRTDIFVSRAS